MVQVYDNPCLHFQPKKEVEESINVTTKQWSNKKLDMGSGAEGKVRFSMMIFVRMVEVIMWKIQQYCNGLYFPPCPG